MKIIITGSLGNISKPLAEKLIAAGHQITIISSSANKSEAIKALGATPAIGSVDDVNFLTKTFTGADAVYTMVPPNFVTNAWKKHIAGIGRIYAEAIGKAGVKHVVNLSSIGAHLPDGAGPISGMHFVELALNDVAGLNVLHLRPASFYTNFYYSTDLIKNAGIIGGNYGANGVLVLVSTNDIADAAADALQQLDFTGSSVSYIVSSQQTGPQIAGILGAAIGKPQLPWVEFKDEDVVNAMLGNHASADVAANYAEMGAGMRTGIIFEDFFKSTSVVQGKTSLEEFAKEFAKAF